MRENKEVLTDKSYYTIFVALPSGFSDSINILKKINSFAKDTSEKKLRIWIKIHPTIDEKKIRKYFGHIWPHIFEIVKAYDFNKDAVETYNHYFEYNKSDNYEQDSYNLTLKINKQLEKMILKKPEQWLWSHNRWK